MIELTQKYKLTKNKTIAVTSSLTISEGFEKEHKNVIRDIENLLGGELKSELSSMFIKDTYFTCQNKPMKQYLITRDGYALLAMGFTGKKAIAFKLKYIKAFNMMEDEIKKHQLSRMDSKESFKGVNDALKELHGDSIKPFIYTNEVKMLNKIVLGMDANSYKLLHGIEGNIRDHLEVTQLENFALLERYDESLIKAGLGYKERKLKCEEYFDLINQTLQ